MNIFSLVSSENCILRDHDVEDDIISLTDSLPPSSSPTSSLPSTPRRSRATSFNNDDSTPPTTPTRMQGTPPRPTSHVEDRIRMRRYRLSLSSSPSSSPGGGDHSPDSDDENKNRSNEDDSTPTSTPRRLVYKSSSSASGINTPFLSSPEKESYDNEEYAPLSSLQTRLNRAKSKRIHLQSKETQRLHHMQTQSASRSHRANELKDSQLQSRILKAHTNNEEKVIQAKERREIISLEKRLNTELSLKKEKEAHKRKEAAESLKIQRAQSELQSIQLAKHRREEAHAIRSAEIEASLELKINLAQRRLQKHLYDKQTRACCQERKERAEHRRKLIVYERRAALLAALNVKLERALERSNGIICEKAMRAGEEIEKAKEVARRVRAVRAIQRIVRACYGFEDKSISSDASGSVGSLTQHGAAERLQRWFLWRACVCRGRFLDGDECDITINDGISKGRTDFEDDRKDLVGLDYKNPHSEAVEALEKLLKLFPLPAMPQGAKQTRRLSLTHQPPPFEELRRHMMHPDTMKLVNLIIECLRPINEIVYASSVGSSCGDKEMDSNTRRRQCMNGIDGRTLLSMCLIAVHPREVLGDNFGKPVDSEEDKSSKGSLLLASSCQNFLRSLHDLMRYFKCGGANEHGRLSDIKPILGNIMCRITSCTTLFQWWKKMDLEQLIKGMSDSLEQSWVVYLTSMETLAYLTAVTGVDNTADIEPKRDDPLVSLRLRHEASRNGARSHIKRIRVSLNKLVGVEEGKDLVKKAKEVAVAQIERSNAMKTLKDEIDEMHSGLNYNDGSIKYRDLLQTPDASHDDGANESEDTTAIASNEDQGQGEAETSTTSDDILHQILRNSWLVHTILLTNPADFDKLSLDGSLSERIPNVSPEEFMAAFHPLPSEQGDETIESLEHVSILLARSMKMAFFQQISQAMTEGNFDPVKSLLKELHSKMRSLLPNRKDLHSHIDDDEVSLVSSIGDIAQLLVRSGYLLATYLESPSRAPTTRKMIDCLKTFKACSRENNGDHQDIPYQMESKQLFIVASIAFVLQKIELCQIDVSNYELSRAAFLLLCVGNEYERKHFQHKYGDYNAASVESLRTMLPSTWNWIKETKMLFENEQVTARSNFENKLNFVSRGFVDVMLFSRSQLSLPEIFALDAENIQHIRNEARCCVIASALVLHACNVSKVGSSVLSLDFISDEVNAAKEELSSVLRRKHFSQELLEISILECIKKLTIALAARELTKEEYISIKNQSTAVLHGNDPVLKLLDNRVQGFLRFACKWNPGVSPATAVPLEMQTGRNILKGGGNDLQSCDPGKEYACAAKKEVSRLGFAFFGSDLMKVGNDARNILTLACNNYGKDILDRFLQVEEGR